MVVSFYEVLRLDRSASLEEVKVAFKRRALQVHPDKGGSKEAFHLVYQAFETLADPAARNRYDLASKPKAEARGSRPKSATSGSSFDIPKQAGPTSKPHVPKDSRADVPKDGRSDVTKAWSCLLKKQNLLLSRLHARLKQLPRDVRHDVIEKDFSQKQRVILEQWMVEKSSKSSETSFDPRSEIDTVCSVASRQFPDMKQGPRTDSERADLSMASFPVPKKPIRKKQANHCPAGIRNQNKYKGVHTINSGCINRNTGKDRTTGAPYRACIDFDGIRMYTGQCELSTALEFLVILTAAKQKVQELSKTNAFFQENLQEALLQSCEEHGRDCADLALRFAVVQNAAFLFGAAFRLQSPHVRKIEDLVKLRKCMDPFRQYAKSWGRSSMFWWYSPEHQRAAWERFQEAVAEMWEIAGGSCAQILQKIRAYHDSNAARREKHLQIWERQHMAMQDKSQHRPKRLRGHFIHVSERRDSDVVHETLRVVKKHLGSWDSILQKHMKMLENHRRKALAQRKRAWQEERRRKEWTRKRARQEQQSRFAFLRQRRKSEEVGHAEGKGAF